MEKPKHTPGPWFTFENKHCVGGPESQPGFGHGIAICMMRSRGREEAQANATLISAAPELFQLAVRFHDAVEYQIRRAENEGDTEGANMRAAMLFEIDSIIAKAMGLPEKELKA